MDVTNSSKLTLPSSFSSRTPIIAVGKDEAIRCPIVFLRLWMEIMNSYWYTALVQLTESVISFSIKLLSTIERARQTNWRTNRRTNWRTLGFSFAHWNSIYLLHDWPQLGHVDKPTAILVKSLRELFNSIFFGKETIVLALRANLGSTENRYYTITVCTNTLDLWEMLLKDLGNYTNYTTKRNET